MFWKKQKPAELFNEFASFHANRTGASRRATSLIPVAHTGTTHEIAHTGTLRFHQLLISLEGNQRTGCLRIVSPKHKSRAAILIYKGRVVGALYGRKKLDYQCLQQDAHSMAMADLAMPGNILDAYELSEELVLAAASLFQGNVLDIDASGTSQERFEQGLNAIAQTRLPGCIVVNTADDEMVCMVYVYDGKIAGIFSAQHGWVSASYEVAISYLKSTKKEIRVNASYLPVEDLDSIGFSLTGLDAPENLDRPALAQLQAVDSFTTIRTETQSYSNIEAAYKQSRPVDRNAQQVARVKATSTSTPVSAVRSHNVFAITP